MSLSLREGVCSGEHLLRQPGAPSWGLGRLVDTPGGGPTFTGRKKVWPYAPEGIQSREPAASWPRRAPGLSAPPWQSCWPLCPSHRASPSPVWGAEEGAEQKYVLGSCPSQRRSSLQVGKPRGADSSCQTPPLGMGAGHSVSGWDPHPCAGQGLPVSSPEHGSLPPVFGVRRA